MLNRRSFLQNSVMATAGLSTLSLSNLFCNSSIDPSMYSQNMGVQLWTVRNLVIEEPERVLKAIKAHGYKQIELYNMENITEVRSIAKDLDLKVNSAHMDAGAFFDPNQPDYFKRHLEEVVKAKQEFAVIGWVPEEHRRNLDDFKRTADLANEAGELAKKANIQLAYHNHNFEFKPFEEGTPYDLLLSETEPDLLHFELDVFWCDLAGYDPVPLMKKIGDRLALLHLKDKKKGIADRYEGSDDGDFKEVGNGELDFPAILEAAQTLGVSHCMVEQDQSPDPLASLGMSMEYLNQI